MKSVVLVIVGMVLGAALLGSVSAGPKFMRNDVKVEAELAEVGWQAAVVELIANIKEGSLEYDRATVTSNVFSAAQSAQNSKKDKTKKPKKNQ